MPIPHQRTLIFDEVRNFGEIPDEFELPDLTQIQTASYAEFLQVGVPSRQRKDQGLEGILREIFPVESYDVQYSLDFLKYVKLVVSSAHNVRPDNMGIDVAGGRHADHARWW